MERTSRSGRHWIWRALGVLATAMLLTVWSCGSTGSSGTSGGNAGGGYAGGGNNNAANINLAQLFGSILNSQSTSSFGGGAAPYGAGASMFG